ncbi:hypothetical protein [Romboutsia sp.]|uniref:hypothetical protein n=1 Tax=Romboutsia sp. TaxID=1965302 RepID=UPI003F327EC5
MLIGRLDGDVVDFAGLGIYEKLRLLDKQKLLSAVLLENANHNYFNSETERNDALLYQSSLDVSKQLTRTEQEDFAKNFVVDFLNTVYNNQKNTIYNTDQSSILKINNNNVYNYLQTTHSKPLININDKDKFILKEAQIKSIKESLSAPDDSAPGVYLPKSIDGTIDLLSVSWKTINSQISFDPNITDFSSYKNINMNVLIDGSSELNEVGKSQGLTIELVDNKNSAVKVIVPTDSNLITYPLGKLDSLDLGDGKVLKYWNTLTPIRQVTVPLSMFEEINLSNIKSVNIIFDQKSSGNLVFESFNID